MSQLVRDTNTGSRRKPRDLTIFNDADNIERYLQADRHKIWGWVIYRSTYASQEDWDEFLSRLRAWIQRSLKRCGGLDMLDSLDYKVFEDSSLFDGASPSTIREHFRKWTQSAPQEGQGTGPAQSQRYQFCIQVDAEALYSVIQNAPPPTSQMLRAEAG